MCTESEAKMPQETNSTILTEEDFKTEALHRYDIISNYCPSINIHKMMYEEYNSLPCIINFGCLCMAAGDIKNDSWEMPAKISRIQLLSKVTEFEQRTNCKVYLCLVDKVKDKFDLILFSVSPFKEDWKIERNKLAHCVPNVYVYNFNYLPFSEAGSIFVSACPIGLYRTYAGNPDYGKKYNLVIPLPNHEVEALLYDKDFLNDKKARLAAFPMIMDVSIFVSEDDINYLTQKNVVKYIKEMNCFILTNLKYYDPFMGLITNDKDLENSLFSKV